MIRLIQRRLIIPRGDTGTFTVPVLATKNTGDVAVFSIIDTLTQKKIFEKIVEVSGEVMNIEFSHADTVNLPVGKYVWDIKFYVNPQFADGVLVDGTEVDSYYAAFTLPVCEIRQTGDLLLTADDAPTSTVSPDSLNVITAAISEANSAKRESAASATNAANSVAEMAALVRAIPTKVSEFENDAGYLTQHQDISGKANSADLAAVAISGSYNDLLNVPTNVSTFTNDAGYLTQHQDISGKANSADLATVATSGSYNDLLNKPFIPSAISDLTDDSGHYTKPVGGIPAADLAETYLTSFTETDPTVPSWAKAAQKPTYTAQEVGALPADTVIPTVPTNVSAFTNDAGYLTSFTEIDPTVPSWAKAVNKPTYTAAEVGAPTVQEMTTAISTAIGNVHQFDIQIVQALPTENIQEHTIYFVPKTGETNDVYDEYIRVNNAWEMIGNTQIDLSNYATKSEIPTVVSQLQNDAGYLTNHQDISGKANAADLATVATSGSYTDLINKPTIPDVPVQDVQVNGTSILNNGVANVPIASANDLGVVKENLAYGIDVTSSGQLMLIEASDDNIKQGLANSRRAIFTKNQHTATFYGLAKAAGDSTQSESDNAVGTYTDDAKAAIKSMIGVNVDDVQINGTSIVSNGVANVPMASQNDLGVMKVDANDYGIGITGSGMSYINKASALQRKSGTGSYRPICPVDQHESTFYGLAKAAGADMKDISETTIGIYPDVQKAAIQSMLGISNFLAPAETTVASKAYSVGESFTSNGKLYKVTTAIAQGGTIITQDIGATVSEHNAEETKISEYVVRDVQINGTSIMQNGVANVPIASDSAPGVMKISNYNGTGIGASGSVFVVRSTDAEVKTGSQRYKPIVPESQHISTFYGLAKAAGDSTQSQSDNPVGTYTDDAKTAIRGMLGTVGDVQVNGTSVVSNGVANVPVATTSEFGVVKYSNSNGVVLGGGGLLTLNKGSDDTIKAGTSTEIAVRVEKQHISTFYGLAKASGDTTQSASSNAVGAYTDSAKASIKSMLGIVDGSTGTVSISGTTPTITAVENTRYVCGEVATLSFTPSASGISIVRFTSGTTATVLTLPNTVIFPEWFDATALEANTIYEMCITDGIYGAVMSWAL